MSKSAVTTSTWVADLAVAMHAAYRAPIPDAALERAALQVFDGLACAAGAVDAPPVRAARKAVEGSGPQVASVWFRPERVNLPDAVLLNGSALRYLDFNDAFLGTGPSGHPSDNIPVALAVGEREGSSGREVMAALVLGYELYWRFRKHIYGPSDIASGWDGTSASGIVSALIAGLLTGLDEEQLTQALAIGAAKGYGLKELRRGSISTLKAAGNAMVAREGLLGALMAREGMTGPPLIFEGKSGLLAAFGLEASAELHDILVAPPSWVIENVAIKMYPSIGTSQAAIYGAILIAEKHRPAPESIESITVHVPASLTTSEHISIEQRKRPTTRETADHSMPFLIAAAIEDGALSHAQFDDERWLNPRTNALMERVTVVPDEELAALATNCYPARVEVVMSSGEHFVESVHPTPGSPDRPWGADDVVGKFAGVQRVGLDAAGIQRIRDEIVRLPTAPDLSGLLAAVGAVPVTSS